MITFGTNFKCIINRTNFVPNNGTENYKPQNRGVYKDAYEEIFVLSEGTRVITKLTEK